MYKIYYHIESEHSLGSGTWHTEYKTKGNAVKQANKLLTRPYIHTVMVLDDGGNARLPLSQCEEVYHSQKEKLYHFVFS